jgi:hypothetical protein
MRERWGNLRAKSRLSAKLFLKLSELVLGGGAHSHAREGVPIPMRGHTLWYSKYICSLCLIWTKGKNN